MLRICRTWTKQRRPEVAGRKAESTIRLTTVARRGDLDEPDLLKMRNGTSIIVPSELEPTGLSVWNASSDRGNIATI